MFFHRVTKVVTAIMARLCGENWEGEAALGREMHTQSGEMDSLRKLTGSQGLQAAGDRRHIEIGVEKKIRELDVATASWSFQAPPHCRPVCPLHLVLCSSPLSPSALRSAKLCCCLHGQKGGSSYSSCFLYVLSPVYSSSFRILEPWDPTQSETSFFFAFCHSTFPWKQWMLPWETN